MLYIVVALKAEAQAFVDMYKLKKIKQDTSTLFINKDITLIISGIGTLKAENAAKILINNFTFCENDRVLNVGICGASRRYKIGELLEIGSVIYDNQTFVLNASIHNTITCLDKEAKEEKYEIVDMESFGFYKAFSSVPEIKNIYIFKVVSDYCEPSMVTKEKTKQLIFTQIETIQRILQR